MVQLIQQLQALKTEGLIIIGLIVGGLTLEKATITDGSKNIKNDFIIIHIYA